MRQGAAAARVLWIYWGETEQRVRNRLRKRATPIERDLARVCREAGARVRFNAFLQDMNIGIEANDGRRS